MASFNSLKVRPKDDWALILADQRQDTLASGIILASETGAEKVTEFAGELIRLGGGKLNATYTEHAGLVPGVRVLYRGFLKYANPLPTDETWPDGKRKEFFFIDSKDILGIVAPGVAVGVFSGRPSVPHVQPRIEK